MNNRDSNDWWFHPPQCSAGAWFLCDHEYWKSCQSGCGTMPYHSICQHVHVYTIKYDSIRSGVLEWRYNVDIHCIVTIDGALNNNTTHKNAIIMAGKFQVSKII